MPREVIGRLRVQQCATHKLQDLSLLSGEEILAVDDCFAVVFRPLLPPADEDIEADNGT